MDDDTSKGKILLKSLHTILGNPASFCFFVATAVSVGLGEFRQVNVADVTIDYLAIMGCSCGCSGMFFWMRGRRGLCRIFTHLGKAAEMLEDLGPSTEKSLQKKMARVAKMAWMPCYGLWVFCSLTWLGAAVTGLYPIRIYFFEGTPHWFRMMIEVAFHGQVAGIVVPSLYTAILLFVLASGALLDTLNEELRKCRGDEQHLMAIVEVHQQVMIASTIARNLFQDQFLIFGLIWCSTLIVSLLNIVTGCYSVLPVGLTPLATSVIACACEAGDILVWKSTKTWEAVFHSGWELAGKPFRQRVVLILLRSKQPAHLTIRMVGICSRPRLKILNKMYSIFTLMLSAFDDSSC